MRVSSSVLRIITSRKNSPALSEYMPCTGCGSDATWFHRPFGGKARRMSRYDHSERHEKQLGVRVLGCFHCRRRVGWSHVGVLASTRFTSPNLLAGGYGEIL